MKAGSHWYAVLGPTGEAIGYGALVIGAREDGGLEVAWRLAIALPAGPFEEERAMVLDPDQRLESASYRSAVQETRFSVDGTRIVGERRTASGDVIPIEKDVADDAIAGTGFVLAASLPREPGHEMTRTRIEESEDGRNEGTLIYRVVGPDPVRTPEGTFDATRVVLSRPKHHDFVVWVDAEDGIVQAGGGGMVIQRRNEETTSLFQPRVPAVLPVETGDPEQLVLAGTFPGIAPESMFALFTDPTLLTRWWPQRADVEPRVGGRYRMVWLEPPWTLDGQVTVWEPGSRLGFTWAWAHQPDAPALEVEVTFVADGSDTRVQITHGPYGDNASERAKRGEHHRGWMGATDRLRGVVSKLAST